jgi:hypothetical protein
MLGRKNGAVLSPLGLVIDILLRTMRRLSEKSSEVPQSCCAGVASSDSVRQSLLSSSRVTISRDIQMLAFFTFSLPREGPGAPPPGWEGGSWVSPSPASFRDDIDTHKPRLRQCVELPTAPWPILRMIHQSRRQGIAVHVFELLSFLPVCVYIEVVKPCLPERSDAAHRFRKDKSKLSREGFSVFLSQLFGHLGTDGTFPDDVLTRSETRGNVPCVPIFPWVGHPPKCPRSDNIFTTHFSFMPFPSFGIRELKRLWRTNDEYETDSLH